MKRPIQQNLFNRRPTLNVAANYNRACWQAARECGLSRDQIADEMNDLAGEYGVKLNNGNAKKLSKETLEKWLNPNDARQVPMKALPVFCAVVNSLAPLRALATPLFAEVIGREDQTLLKWARAYHRARAARKEMRKLEGGIR